MKILMSIVLLVLLLVGCSKTEFVVLREVPHNPSFQVVPTYIDPYEIAYANNIERALIGSGVKVLTRPPHKEVTTEKISQQEKIREKTYETRKLEYTFEYGEIKADYLVQTFYNPRQIKIIKVATQEILTVFIIPVYTRADSTTYRREKILSCLAKLGIIQNTK